MIRRLFGGLRLIKFAAPIVCANSLLHDYEEDFPDLEKIIADGDKYVDTVTAEGVLHKVVIKDSVKRLSEEGDTELVVKQFIDNTTYGASYTRQDQLQVYEKCTSIDDCQREIRQLVWQNDFLDRRKRIARCFLEQFTDVKVTPNKTPKLFDVPEAGVSMHSYMDSWIGFNIDKINKVRSRIDFLKQEQRKKDLVGYVTK
jgi:hypothetical protein